MMIWTQFVPDDFNVDAVIGANLHHRLAPDRHVDAAVVVVSCPVVVVDRLPDDDVFHLIDLMFMPMVNRVVILTQLFHFPIMSWRCGPKICRMSMMIIRPIPLTIIMDINS